MATIRRFDDIGAWQGARQLVKEIYRVAGQASFASLRCPCQQYIKEETRMKLMNDITATSKTVAG